MEFSLALASQVDIDICQVRSMKGTLESSTFAVSKVPMTFRWVKEARFSTLRIRDGFKASARKTGIKSDN